MGFSSKRCPISAEFVLAMREAFGDVQVLAVKENNYAHDPEHRLADRDDAAAVRAPVCAVPSMGE